MILMGKEIGLNKPPFYVAELSQNYRDLGEAYDLIESCKEAGADAIKIQFLLPNELTINCDNPDFICKEGLWKGKKLYDLYHEANEDDIQKIFDFGEEIQISVFSSVFGFKSLELLEKMHCPAYKISSFENNWPELIQGCRDTGKPLFISTGLAPSSKEQCQWSCANIIMHCVSSYPCRLVDVNLRKISDYQQIYPLVGFSDHTIGTKAAEYAVVLGACVIEKHVTLSNNTVDGNFSARPDEFARLVKNCNEAWQATYGAVNKQIEYDPEADYAQYKRSIYVVDDINVGDIFTVTNVRVIRPSYGLLPSSYNDIIGKVALKDLKRGDPLKEEDVEW